MPRTVKVSLPGGKTARITKKEPVKAPFRTPKRKAV